MKFFLYETRTMGIRLLLWLGVLLGFIALLGLAQSQPRAPRVALVIGNAAYSDPSTPLSTTIRDTRTIAEELRRNEFEVDLKENLGKEDMQRALDAFMGKIRAGSTALFYFSGYGIQTAKQTFLIPINAKVWNEADLRREGFGLDTTLAEMNRRGAKAKIVIIDAARRNPFERRFRAVAAGLAVLDAPEGTLAIYSAAPGKLINEGSGTNSVFVTELMKEMRIPNVTAEEVFSRVRIGVSRATNNEQTPWVSSSLGEDFYFGSRSASTTLSPSLPPAPAPSPPPAPAPPIAAAPAPPSAPAPAPPSASPGQNPAASAPKPAQPVELVRAVAADQKLRLDFLYSINPDCSSIGFSTVRIIEPPKNGRLTVKNGAGFTNFPQGNPRFECNKRRSDGVVLQYEPNPGFSGTDSLTVDVVFASGSSSQRHYAIGVK